tara:strand:- start:19541 stop:20119 length:579 start_codon:yes stop_codon:yes gene_type:complete
MKSSEKSSNACKNKLLNLLAKDAYRYGNFTLASGRKSNHYINCKPVTLSGIGLELISSLFLDSVELEARAVAGLTLGADPLVSGVAMAAALTNRPLDALIVRKKPKGYGTDAWLEGPLPPKGSLITVLEDVVTTGSSSIKAVNHLRDFGYCVNKVVTIVDREEGADQAIKNEGLILESIFILNDLISISKAL